MDVQQQHASGPLRQRLVRWREIFFTQKYRFDLGQSFLVIVNFTLLIITASDKLSLFLGIPRLRSLILLIVPVGFLGVWLFGYFMDKVVRAAQMAERQSMKRSEVWTRHNEQMNRIERELSDVKALLQQQNRG
ncbi:MAG: hypothetical protein L0Y80_06895 [Ignavibacteriae bacterium]|nr:hypothetical protein [Ignavibacteriota bacterium]